ncbi:DUF2752 domain-containing protein [Rhodoflexus sp.]
MVINNKRKIAILAICCAGYIFLWLKDTFHISYGGCTIKYVTGIPCPSCGTTRFIQSLIQGGIMQALYYNPLGFISLALIIAIPPVILYDFIFGKKLFDKLYSQIENIIRSKKVATMLIFMIICNWIWNIYKYA